MAARAARREREAVGVHEGDEHGRHVEAGRGGLACRGRPVLDQGCWLAVMEREISERVLETNTPRPPHTEPALMESDTPEQAAEILRKGGHRDARVCAGGVYYAEADPAIDTLWLYAPWAASRDDMNGLGRGSLSWSAAARECLRRWPVTP